jgi:4'-phosphopantetheinyl transferase
MFATSASPGPHETAEQGRERLAPNEIHVWHATLDAAPADVPNLHCLLSGDELERAGRFRFERDRARYVVGRALLRTVLARYLDRDPRELRFRYGTYGKPSLHRDELWFNLSHSGVVMLLAVTAIGEVGIDVELESSAPPDHMRLAQSFFSRAEGDALHALPAAEQPRAFLSCWTRKEAFIKARGDGLGLALDSFDVSLEPGQSVALLRTGWSSQEPGEWNLCDLSDSDGGYIAALAIRAGGPLEIGRRTLRTTEPRQLESEQETG